MKEYSRRVDLRGMPLEELNSEFDRVFMEAVPGGNPVPEQQVIAEYANRMANMPEEEVDAEIERVTGLSMNVR